MLWAALFLCVGVVLGAYTPPAGYTYCACSRKLGKQTRFGPRCHVITSSALQGSFIEQQSRWYPDAEFGAGNWGIKEVNGKKVVVTNDCLWTCSPISLPCMESPSGAMYTAAECKDSSGQPVTPPYPDGTTCTQGCETTKYQPAKGQPAVQNIQCKMGGWTRPKCQAKTCTTAPPAPTGGGTYRNGCKCTGKYCQSAYSRWCSVTCPSGTKQSGSMYCSYGKWSDTAPNCVKPSTTGCDAADITMTLPTGAKWLCGKAAFYKTCQLGCPTGLAPAGSMPRCNSPGTWSVPTGKQAPQCLKIHCKGSADVGYGSRGGGIFIKPRPCADKPEGYVCPISCPWPMRQKKGATCGADGKWQKGECARTCGAVPHPTNGRFTDDCAGKWSGETCTLDCNAPYQKTGDAECLLSGKWSDVYCANPNEKECAFSDLKAPPQAKGPSWIRPVVRPGGSTTPAPVSTANNGKWECTNGVNSGQTCQLACSPPYYPQGGMPYCRDGSWVYPCSSPPNCFWSGAVVGRPYLLDGDDKQGLASKCVTNHQDDGVTWSTVNDIDALAAASTIREHEMIASQGGDDSAHNDMVAMLSSAEKESMAKYWAEAGIGEHASVAAFSKVSLLLMSAQSPPELLAGSHQAAIDEIKHAKLCFELAKSYGVDVPSEPGAFPAHSLDITGDKMKLALSTFKEGCLSETISVVDAATRLEYATDPKITNVLDIIVTDESRHAGLAWTTVGWIARTEPELMPQLEKILEEFSPVDHINAAVSAAPGSLMEGQGMVTDNSKEMAERAVPCLMKPLYADLVVATTVDYSAMTAAGCNELPASIQKAYGAIASAATSAQIVEYYQNSM